MAWGHHYYCGHSDAKEGFTACYTRFSTARDRAAGCQIGNNARLYQHGGSFFVRLYNLDVVQITKRGTWILRTNKYRSRSVLWVLNDHSPARVRQDRKIGAWSLADGLPFYSGIEVDSAGKPIRPIPARVQWLAAKQAREQRLARNVISRAYARAERARKRLAAWSADHSVVLPVTDFPHLRNVENRRIFIGVVGLAKILKHYNAKMIDMTSGGYSVLSIDDEDLMPEYDRRKDVRPPDRGGRFTERYLYLQMVNPSTGEIHVEGIPPTCVTVSAARIFRNQTEEIPVVLT